MQNSFTLSRARGRRRRFTFVECSTLCQRACEAPRDFRTNRACCGLGLLLHTWNPASLLTCSSFPRSSTLPVRHPPSSRFLHFLNLRLRFPLLLHLQLPFHQIQAIHELLLEGLWTLRRRSPMGLNRANEVLRQLWNQWAPLLAHLRCGTRALPYSHGA